MPQTEKCVLGHENKMEIANMKEAIGEIKGAVKDLTNHYSKRLPAWATLAIVLLSNLATALIILKLR